MDGQGGNDGVASLHIPPRDILSGWHCNSVQIWSRCGLHMQLHGHPCSNTAPRPVALASVCRMNGLVFCVNQDKPAQVLARASPLGSERLLGIYHSRQMALLFVLTCAREQWCQKTEQCTICCMMQGPETYARQSHQ